MSNIQSGAHDPTVPSAPADTVQDLKLSREGDLLAACAWDGTLSLWQVSSGLRAEARMQIRGDAPILSVAWIQEDSALCYSDVEGSVKLWDLRKNEVVSVGSHSKGVKAVAWSEDNRLVVSGAWDSTVRLWDLRSPRAVFETSTRGRVFGLTAKQSILATVQSEGHCSVWDLRQLQQKTETKYLSDLEMKVQLRTVALTGDGKSVAIGDINGRIFIKNIILSVILRVETDFSFKMYSQSAQSFPLNSLCFHPVTDQLFAGSSEGIISAYSKSRREKQATLSDLGGPVTAMDVCGTLVAYAVGYDWMSGVERAGSVAPKIALREVQRLVQPPRH